MQFGEFTLKIYHIKMNFAISGCKWAAIPLKERALLG
ncbi:hypothetical protein SAMN05192553_102345 [Cyclobacterium xiamenense]|uniref:Uncharacterized protein n=1 Tax=Cyclobacterium xiamenense TaxID=1297121 RepID=A0A1H6W575_9BACT|nr:hypothetical protein SAMN05192553_102345 [Cyclobacterium xiamenense]